MNNYTPFFNRCFNKARLKNFIIWFFNRYGHKKTITLIEWLKNFGFQHATLAGISIGVDDLKVPFTKSEYIDNIEQKIKIIELNYKKGELTEIERRQQFIDEWNILSEKLKYHVVQFFKATDIFNPIYMMAFSGARGNISQIRQLIGMRGLMSDPQGQILDFPIRSNFKEGLTLIEYLVSCYGARKGVVDTALRTATSGYLTRRLIDVTQQVIVSRQDCRTKRGIMFTNLIDNGKIVLSLRDRIIGRVLAKNVFEVSPLKKKQLKIGSKNQEISSQLSSKIAQTSTQVLIRSPLTCCSKNSICQLCYGWNLSSGTIVSIGEAIGILAAQSIGEPGTQLTMRTFHTGGVFTGGIIDQIYAPFDGTVEYIDLFQGVLIRTLKGQVGFLTKTNGRVQIVNFHNPIKLIKKNFNRPNFIELLYSTQLKFKSINKEILSTLIQKIKKVELSLVKDSSKSLRSNLVFNIPAYTILFIRQSGFVSEKNLIAELSSPSFLTVQQQEAEQEVFSSFSGQVFFENLTLIEKIKRNGNINRITSGTGAVWVIAGSVWNLVRGGESFPIHGDFISYRSTAQQIQILIEKLHYLNFNLSRSVKNVLGFTKNQFIIEKRKRKFQKKPFEDIFLNRIFACIFFDKLAYVNFYYIVKFYFHASFYEKLIFKNFTVRLVKDEIKRAKRSRKFRNYSFLKLNFNFYKAHINKASYKKSFKSKFLLHADSGTEGMSFDYKNQRFFYNFPITRIVKSKYKKPIISRKSFDFQGLNLNLYNYYFWVKITSLNVHLNIFRWSRCLKNKKSFEILKLKFKFIENPHLSKLALDHTLAYINDSIIFQNFFKILTFQHLPSYFLPEQFNTFFNKNIWTPQFRLILFQNNRQGLLNIYPLNHWYLNPIAFNDSFKRKNQSSSIYKFLFFTNKLKSQFKCCNFQEFNNIKFSIKPILLSGKLLVQSFISKKFLIKCTIQKFFDYFYNLTQPKFNFGKNVLYKFKKRYLAVGFQTRFKANIFLNLKSLNKKTFIQLNFKKNYFSPKNNFLFLRTQVQQKVLYRQQQVFASWVYLGPKNLIKNFGLNMNLGQIVNNRICFNQTQTTINVISKTDSYIKEKLQKCIKNNYKHVRNFKPRFVINQLFLNPLILFQKINTTKIENQNYLKNSLLKHYFKDDSFINSLILNNDAALYFRFQKRALAPQKVPEALLLQPQPYRQNLKTFSKVETKLWQYKKIRINPVYCFSLSAYFPIYRKNNQEQLFVFNNLKNDEINKNNFTNRGNSFDSKSFNLCLIQKLQLNYQKPPFKSNLYKIFYKEIRPYSHNSFILIQFFSKFKNSEIINLNFTNKKYNFIILNQFNLKAFWRSNKSSLAKKSKCVNLGCFIRYSDKLINQKFFPESGQVIYTDSKKIIIRKATPFLITSRSILSTQQNQIVSQGKPLFRSLYYHIKTGDIVQGIPKIEEFFEARSTREGMPLIKNLHSELKNLFNDFNLKLSRFKSAQKSFETIQQLIIDEIQKVYCSQGIYIADKHLEIVIRQMTSKVQIIEGNQTGLLSGELVDFDFIRSMNSSFISEKIVYEPILLGITKTCLEMESFISAASFQETTRILTKAALQNKIDFIRGLKQNVILGNLIPAGTGFFSSIYFKSF